ncbi:SRPBCC family protein [Saccharopolyspora taberi]|uniref:SRPBCC family protein n=1 Tax=Saccharopolyspora taberi TaxID=60895 RepID=A0ABN3VCZ2_9PSEU
MNRESFRPGPLSEVHYEAADAGWTVVFVRDLGHPPEKVWDALTDPEQLAEWSPFVPDRDLGGVGDATLTMIDGETREDVSSQVLRAERPVLLEYSWDTDVLRWELEATGTGTRLTLRHTLRDRSWIPMVTAGWHLCLDVAEHLLDGDPVGPIRGGEAKNFGWAELRTAYAAKLDLPDA